MTKYYDGTRLLSTMDINGNKPEIYICTTNRTGGKTTWFNRYLIKKFKETGEQFMLIYRFVYELDDVPQKFFSEINRLFFPDDVMDTKMKSNGKYIELYLNESICGYAVALNSADQIKKYSHVFANVKRMLMDEFQSETNKYCANEVQKFISIHTSVARGKGEQSRYVPTFLIGNPVTILNPYYVELGIATRLNANTKILRGIGYVVEQGFIESASNAQKESAFNQAFATNKYVNYSAESVYLNDSVAFIEEIKVPTRYVATIKFKDKNYAIRECAEYGIIYCDDKVDHTFKYKISLSAGEHQINYVMLKQNDWFIQNMRYYFEHGSFRFKNLLCKECVLTMLSYH